MISDHPLVQDKLARLRDRSTPHNQFRLLLEEVSIYLFYEAMAQVETVEQTVATPLEEMSCNQIRRRVLLVPILRAGLGMANGILRNWPEAVTGMLGMYRDHDTLEPVNYYLRLPEDLHGLEVLLLDPMLATGGSAVSAVSQLKAKGADHVTMIAVICAPEGVARLASAHPDVTIHAAALDRQLNEKGYILPGLGDAGDRYFGV